ncbi:response regulator transcription factor [Streptomyces sp. NPDC047082]|uniref:response regulator transcription factor n=1 Tax=Streptomyces sp. NPDC047082 TaxID=3155259 RepID=UPI0033D44BBF
MKALLVEDDLEVFEALSEGLRQHGWVVEHVSSGEAALQADLTCDIVLLDLNLPDMDGLEVCQNLRVRTGVPIIAVTARSDELDMVLCLRLGADDYIVKPYRLQELLARMAAVRRRVGSRPAAQEPPEPKKPDPHVIAHGRLVIDELERQVRLDGQPIRLTLKEFELLLLLARSPRRVFTRSHLQEAVWSDRWIGTSRTLDSHVSALRRKLREPGWIKTVRGVGFSFEPQPAAAD